MFKHLRWIAVLPLICLIFVIGCGGDEEEMDNDTSVITPTETDLPDYFPNTIGSRWAYRNSNGFEWAREVTDTRFISGNTYHVFAYDPPLENPPFDYLRTPSYRTTIIGVFFFVGGEINQSVQTSLKEFYEALFADSGNVKVNVNTSSKSDLTFFRLPPIRGKKWEVINMKIVGNIVFQDFGNFQIPFEMNWVVTGVVEREETVETPAGVFENSFKIQYDSKLTTIVEGEEETDRELTDIVWIAPEVGIVKIQSDDVVAELISYDVKPAE